MKEHGMRTGEGAHGMGMHTPDPGGHEELGRLSAASCAKAGALLDQVSDYKKARRTARPGEIHTAVFLRAAGAKG